MQRGFGSINRPLRGAVAVAVVATAVGSLVSVAALPANAAGSTVTGEVYEDYNGNGQLDGGSLTGGESAKDVGVGGITVRAYDSTGTLVGTTTTSATAATLGQYTLTVSSAAGAALTVETVLPSGSPYYPAPHGTQSGTTVQKVSAGATNVDVGLQRAGDYSPDGPTILRVEQRSAITSSNTRTVATSEPTIISQPNSTRGVDLGTTIATADQTGSIWGIAQENATYAFTGAYFKRHSVLGSSALGTLGSTGTIYLTNVATKTTTVLTNAINAGTDPRTVANESSTTYDWFHDTAAYTSVGTIGLGGMALSPDKKTLYVINLFDKSLYSIPLTYNASGVPSTTSASITKVALPTNQTGNSTLPCATANVRPFALTYQNNALWVGLTCTSPISGNANSALAAYVYSYNPTSGAFTGPVFQTSLAGTRGYTYTGCQVTSQTGSTTCPADWNAWTTDTTWFSHNTNNPAAASQPQPLLSDIAFDSNGDLTIAVKDRFGDQAGYGTGSTTASDTTRYEGFPGGDELRACLNGTTTYTLESNGSCGGVAGGLVNSHNGPGGGNFYDNHYGTSHAHTALGALLQLPGYGDIQDTSYDPESAVRTEGTRYLPNNSGVSTSANNIQYVPDPASDTTGGFGKSGGLGDMAALVTDAPIEIGNYVWNDANRDGIQEAGEAGIAGVTVDLYAHGGTTAIATAKTDANGQYYFSSATGTSTTSVIYGVPLVGGTQYDVRIDKAADYTGTGPLAGLQPTTTTAGTDTQLDSNGTAVSSTSTQAVVTVTTGVSDHTIDFGFTPQTYAVGDYVWKDTDKNGTQGTTAAEPPVQGVTVTLLNSDGTAAHHPDGSAVATTTTDAAGHYVFDFLAAGSYEVKFSNLPTGYVFTTQNSGTNTAIDSNPNVTTGITPAFTLGASDTNVRPVAAGDGTTIAAFIDPTIDAGIVPGPSVSVGDFVWSDTNHNGIQDSGEPGIPGVSVTLTGPSGGAVTDIFGNAVGAATTDANGKYTFANLPVLTSGSYTVHVNNAQTALAGAGYVPTTPQAAGSTTANDSSTSTASSTGLTTAGSSDTTLDFGFIKPLVSVGDFVWSDTNHNGIQDSGEPGIPNVTVTLANPAGTTIATTTTDANGKYLFSGLPALASGQSYTVKIDNSQAALAGAGYVPTKAQAAGSTTANDSSTSSAASVTTLTTDGASDLTLDFGFIKPLVSVGDFVWIDSNHDGVQQTGEPGIPNVTVTLLNPAGTQIATTTTDSTGHYLFSNLPAIPSTQHYTVKIDNTQAALAGAGYVPTLAGQGTDPTKDSSTGSAASIADLSTDGSSDLSLDFGFVKPAVSVGDFVWRDTNRNGIQDSGEPGINGVTVTLTGPTGGQVTDVNGNLVGPTTTNTAGKYLFTNLPALPAGQHYTVTINNNQAPLAGYIPTTSQAAGSTTANDSSNPSATSTDLTTDGASDLTLDFGFIRPAVTVGDRVWIDSNHDGIQNVNSAGAYTEPGIQGVTVSLTGPGGAAVTNVLGNAVTTTTTDANGNYSFPNLPVLPAGQHYTVTINNSQTALTSKGLVPTKAQATGSTTANDSSTGSATSGDLTTDGASDLTLDFGFVVPVASVGDFVWYDANHDGIQQSTEKGIPNVQVTLTGPTGGTVTDVTGATVGPATTDANGKYLFSNLPVLPAGQHYTVTINNNQAALAGYSPTLSQATGSTTANDSSNPSATSTDLTTDGSSDLTLDFGFFKPAVSVGDFVWVDSNRNGLQDAGEPGIQGVQVTITGPTGGPVTDINGNVVGPATTNASGKYLFSNLPALPIGQSYTVTINNSQAALGTLVPTLANQGTDRSKDSSTGSATTSSTAAANLSVDGASDLTLDFGFVVPSVSVGDYVWFDANHNGVQNTSEKGIPGVTVTLTDAAGNPVKDNNGVTVGAATTDANGKYLFSNLPILPAGTHYFVHVDNTQATLVNNHYAPTITGGTSDTTLDSSNGVAESSNLTTNQSSDLTLDFGFYKPTVSVGDFVWQDSNFNGIQDAGEPGIAGVVVTILGPGGAAVTDVNNVPVTSATTDGTGHYLFPNLPPLPVGQSYTVSIDNGQTALSSTGLTPTTPQAPGSTTANDSSTGSQATIADLSANGASDTSIDFGFVPPVYAVGDRVFSDDGKDGIQDPSDGNVAGSVVTLLNADGTAAKHPDGTAVASQTTGSDGAYLFDFLSAGDYRVKFTDPDPGTSFTQQQVGTDPTVDSNPDASGLTPVFTLGPVGTGNMTAKQPTDTFDGVAIDRTIDAGIVQLPAVSVGDYVFWDKNGDGIQQTGPNGDVGIPGVQLTLTGPGNTAVQDIFGNQVAPVTTDSTGRYLFSNLPPLPANESYTVHVDNAQSALSSYVPTVAGAGTDPTLDSSTGSAASGPLTVDGASDTSLDFGFVKKTVTVGDYVWQDSNFNGLQDLGEHGIPNVTVTITGPNGAAVTDVFGNPVTSAVTDSTGHYTFTNLPPLPAGQGYTVSIDNTQSALTGTGLTPTTPHAPGTTSADDSSTGSETTTADLSDSTGTGASDTSIDFGFVPPTYAVGDFTWKDTNRDGIYEPGPTEVAVGGLTVTLQNADGTPARHPDGTAVAPVQSDNAGHYVFDFLSAGSYKEVFSTLPSGYQFTIQNAGTDTSIDSNPDQTTGITPVFTLGAVGSTLPAMRPVQASDGTTRAVAIDPSIDAGIYRLATVTVGDRVWSDTNHDGIQNTDASGNYTEPGIPGVTVVLTGPTGGPVTDIFGNAVNPVQTDANGNYSFANLPALTGTQAYTVSVDDNQTALISQGYVPTKPNATTDTSKDSSTGSASSGALTTNGASDLTLDFGFIKPAVTVGDTVWSDVNHDGIYDSTVDPGISGVVLTISGPRGTLLDSAGNPLTATTDSDGHYEFTGLPALTAGQSYTVHVDNSQPALAGAGYTPTTPQAPGSTTADDSSTGSATSGDLTTDGASDLTLDFGFVVPAVSVGDYIWQDTNRDGIQDAGEPGLKGVVVTITGPGGAAVTDVNGKPVTSVTTDANGHYLFPNLPALPVGESYTVSVDPTQPALANLIPTLANQGSDPSKDSSTGPTATTADLSKDGESDLDVDFGFVVPEVSVGDFVWSDVNHNGIQDSGEPGIPQVVVTLTGPTGGTVTDVFGNPVQPATTDAKGNYTFTGLPALPAGQHYTVNIDNTQPTLAAAGFIPTTPQATGSTTADDSSTGSATSGDLTTDGASDTTLDFGFIVPAVSVGDFIWNDQNHNGIQDAGEPGIPGVVVTITGPGGAPVNHIDGSPVQPATTDSSGHYEFTNLPPLPAGESYTVSVDGTQPALSGPGFVPTLPNQGTDPDLDSATGSYVTGPLTTDGQSDNGADFGFIIPFVSVGDFVWNDLNHNGVQDAGEPGLPGVTVTLVGPTGAPVTDVNGNAVGPQTTDANGAYLFTNLPLLPAGASYTVQIDDTQAALAGFTPTKPGIGDPAKDSSTGSASSTAPLSADGDSDLTLDFGFVTPSVTVGDFVWVDSNHNGLQDAGEPGLKGVVVTITGPNGGPVTDVDGNPVGPQTTDANGAYLFTLLPPLPAGQSYTVHVDPNQPVLVAGGYTPTTPGVGSNRAIDSSTGSYATLADLSADGASDLGGDFGFIVPTVTVGNTVFSDTNGNGKQDAGEPGIGGVTVTITGPNGQPVTGVNGSPVPPQVTAPDGTYTFTGLPTLPAGQGYTVTVSPSQPVLSGYTPTTPTTLPTKADLSKDGATDLGENFGFTPPTYAIGDYVFNDFNHNGIQNGNDPGVKGVTVTLLGVMGGAVTHPDGTPVTPVVTDANGHYVFDNLAAGSYEVKFSNLPTGYTFTVQAAGSDQSKDSNPNVNTGITPVFTIGPASPNMRPVAATDGTTKAVAINPTIDAGIITKPTVSVGDFVWLDNNDNGLQDKGEPGIRGVTVTLTGPGGGAVKDIFGDTVGPVQTDAHGGYLFSGLPVLKAGQQYTVHVDNNQTAITKPGLVPTKKGVGTNRAIDSSTGSAMSETLTKNGASDLTLDFGFVREIDILGEGNTRPTNGTGPLSYTGGPIALLFEVGLGAALIGAGFLLVPVLRRRRRVA